MKNHSEFRLQTVLTVREYQQRRLQHALYEIGQEQERASTLLSQLSDEKEVALFEDSTIVRARATEFQTSKAFIDTLSTQIDLQEQKIEDIKSKEQNTRDELLSKRQSKHMLETLKRTHTEKIRKEEEVQLQKMIDDFGNRSRKGVNS